MAKIANDKYYTPQHIVDLVIQRTKEVIGLENITEFIEPSAGNGAFLDKIYATGIPTKAYDLYPERDDITEQDYLELGLEYKKGRCVIGNPPFGVKNTLSVQFYKKSINISDYIVFVLPISQLNNNQQMYKFNLIHSEDLGKQFYTDRDIHCTLNIYKRNYSGLNKKPNYKLKDVSIIEVRQGNKNVVDSDYVFCAWGSGIGNEVENKNTNEYAKEFYIKIYNSQYKDKILKLLKNAKWEELYPMTATPNLLQWQVYKYLKEQIPELE